MVDGVGDDHGAVRERGEPLRLLEAGPGGRSVHQAPLAAAEPPQDRLPVLGQLHHLVPGGVRDQERPRRQPQHLAGEPQLRRLRLRRRVREVAAPEGALRGVFGLQLGHQPLDLGHVPLAGVRAHDVPPPGRRPPASATPAPRTASTSSARGRPARDARPRTAPRRPPPPRAPPRAGTSASARRSPRACRGAAPPAHAARRRRAGSSRSRTSRSRAARRVRAGRRGCTRRRPCSASRPSRRARAPARVRSGGRGAEAASSIRPACHPRSPDAGGDRLRPSA